MPITVKPGRARVNLKVWTHTMSTDMTGAHMSEEAAQLIYRIAIGGKVVGPTSEAGILEGVLNAMQSAEEIEGPEGVEYVALMERIAAEATQRATNYRAAQGMEPAAGGVLTREERATVLAALRFYQSKGMGEPSNRPLSIQEIATDGDELTSLDDEGIDALCEKMNVVAGAS